MTSYSEKLRDPRWQRKRLEIMNRDGFKCSECADEQNTLHVHHTRYIAGAEPWEYPDSLLATLCERCHAELHKGELSMSESLLHVILRRGGSAFVLGYMMGSVEYVVPSGMQLSYGEWSEAVRAFSEALKEIVARRDGNG